jgi:hypothetical protein
MAVAMIAIVAVIVTMSLRVPVIMACMAGVKDVNAPAVSLVIVLVMDMAVPVCP